MTTHGSDGGGEHGQRPSLKRRDELGLKRKEKNNNVFYVLAIITSFFKKNGCFNLKQPK